MASMKHEPLAYRQPIGSSPNAPGDPLALPPGISSEEFKAYIGSAREIVGEENVTVISTPEELNKESYMDPSKAHDMYHVFDK